MLISLQGRATLVVAALCVSMHSVRAQQLDPLDSVAASAASKLVAEYIAHHFTASDSIEISTTSNLPTISGVVRHVANPSQIVSIYDIRGELRQFGGEVDSLHTSVVAVLANTHSAGSLRLELEASQPLAHGLYVRQADDANRLVHIVDRHRGFWSGVVEPALVLLGGAAIVALFFLIRS